MTDKRPLAALVTPAGATTCPWYEPFVRALEEEGFTLLGCAPQLSVLQPEPSSTDGEVHVIVVGAADLRSFPPDDSDSAPATLTLVAVPWDRHSVDIVTALAMPVLVVQGECDERNRVQYAGQTVKKAENGRLVAVTGTDESLPLHFEAMIAGLIARHAGIERR
jgi:hypothetical protein